MRPGQQKLQKNVTTKKNNKYTWILWTKHPLVTGWVPIVLIASFTYASGNGDIKLLRIADNLVDTKYGHNDCTLIPFDLYSASNAL